MSETFLQPLRESVDVLIRTSVEFLPRLLAAVVILVVGYLLARLMRALTVRAVPTLDRLWERLASRFGLRPAPPLGDRGVLAGKVVFWACMVFVLAAALGVLGIQAVTLWFAQLAAYVPTLIAGVVILIVGYFLGGVTRDLAYTAAVSAGIPQGELIGRAVQTGVVLTALVVGADQVGIETSFVGMILGVTFGVLLAGLALAFGIGARGFIANVLGVQSVRHRYQVGQRVRVGDAEGTILEIFSSKVLLEGPDGQILVPGRFFDEEVSIAIEQK